MEDGEKVRYELEKGLFLLYLPSKLSSEVEIWNEDLIGVLDLSFGGVDFLTQLNPHFYSFR